eukprot:SAG31_NODE_3338_length_4388_cov_1.970856_1_plen_119_part_00
MLELVRRANVVIGNASEARAFATALQDYGGGQSSVSVSPGSSLSQIAELIGQLLKPAESPTTGRVVVITDGADPAVTFDGRSNSEHLAAAWPVPAVDQSIIMDTCGAVSETKRKRSLI